MRYPLPMALLLATIGLAMSSITPSLAKQMAGGRIQIEYVAPKNPDHQALYAQLRERQGLEKAQAILRPFRLPHDIKIRMMGCDGDANAWYELLDKEPTITICYEYLDDLWKHLPKTTTEDGPTPTDALVGQALFVTFHEFGHLLFSVYRVPVFGRAEDAADNVATFLMLHFRQDARRLITGAAWSYYGFIKNYRQNPNATLPLRAFSSNHGQPEERFYNMACIAYGSDKQRYADLVERGLLPQSRAIYCKNEFDMLRFAFQSQILPHIDRKLADEVLARDWLASAPPPAPLR